MAVPKFIAKPLHGMGTGLGRFVLKLLKLAVAAVVTLVVFVLLDRVLLPDGIEDEVRTG